MNARRINRGLGKRAAAWRDHEFVAPVNGHGFVFLATGKAITQLGVVAAEPGWWRMRVADANTAAIIEPATPWERDAYLESLPTSRYVLMDQVGPWRWTVLPVGHMEDLPANGQIRMDLVEGGQMFERVIGRHKAEAQAIWFDALDRRTDPSVAETLRAALLTDDDPPEAPSGYEAEYAAFQREREARQHTEHLRMLIGNTAIPELVAKLEAIDRELADERTVRAGRRWARRHWQLVVEDLLRRALAIGGANLIELQGNYLSPTLQIVWERQGTRRYTWIDRHLNVINAGFCLAGGDRNFDLSSLVSVALHIEA